MRYLLFFLFIFLNCKKSDENISTSFKQTNLIELYSNNEKKISINTGVCGTLIMTEGNCMPMIIDQVNENNCRQFPVQRKLYFYQYTTAQNLIGEGPSYIKITSPLVSIIETDKDGFFQLTLNEGKYSVFIEDNGKYYANQGDGFGGINPVEVKQGKVVIFNLNLDYAAY